MFTHNDTSTEQVRLAITPVRPVVGAAMASQGGSPAGLLRRTLGGKLPSRRTLGGRWPSRRTLGGRTTPSRRTVG